jgi:hypothetical protein
MAAAVKIRSPVPADAEAVGRILYEAQNEFHDFYAALFAMHPREMIPRLARRALRRPEEIFLVAEEVSTGAVVGFIRYVVMDATGEAEQAAGAAEAEKPAGQGDNNDDSTLPIKFFLETKPHMKELHTRFKEAQARNDDIYETTSKGIRHNCTLIWGSDMIVCRFWGTDAVFFLL